MRIATHRQFNGLATYKTVCCLTLLSITLMSALATAQQKSTMPGPRQTVAATPDNLIDWPQFHFDSALDGYNPYENILGPSNVGNVTLKWSYAPSEGYGVTGEPAVVNGVMYFGIAYTGFSEKQTKPSNTFAL